MSKTILLFFVIALNTVSSQNYKKVEIFFNSPDELRFLSNELDHVSKNSGNSVTAFLSDEELKQTEANGFRTKTLIDDWHKYYDEVIIPRNREFEKKSESMLRKTNLVNFDYGTMGGYYKLNEVYARLDKMFQLYPTLITAKQSIRLTNENREIYFVKISDNPNVDENEAEVLYTALHHAREPESMMQMIYFMWYLLENYDKDSQVKYLVDNREIYFIPVVNPDGYYYNATTNSSGGGMWRKNRRDNGDGTFGVDLNRNYGPMEYWNSPNGGSSTSPNSDTYRGVAPFSEPETDAIREFLSQHDISNCLNYHTFSNLLIYPYGALGKETSDSLIFRDFAKDMTQFNNYVYGTDDQTVGYTTRGNSDDYFYDGDTVANGKIFAMTPEVGNGSDGFWPEQSRIIPLAEENVFPNLYWLWIADGYANVSKISYSKDLFSQDDTVYVSLKLKHKGLGSLGNFDVLLESAENGIEILNNKISIEKMSSQEEISFDSVFSIKILSSVLNGTKIKFKVLVVSFGVEISKQEYSFIVGSPNYVFVDKVDFADTLWSATNQGWKLSPNDFYSSEYSFTDSPAGYYSPDFQNELSLNNPIDLTDIQEPVLSFYTKFDIEKNWDYGQVLISSDNGISWKEVGGDLSSIGSGDFQPFDEPVYDGKVSDWTKEEIDLSAFSGENIVIKFVLTSDSYIEFDGWYIDDISIYSYLISDAENVNSTVTSFMLSQNYPNPFNPSTTIRYSVPSNVKREMSNVKIIVYDILGNEVTTLVNENKPAGVYNVQCIMNNVSSGIYFYTLKAGSFSETKKMLLLR